MPVSHNVVTTDAGKFFFGVHTVSTKQFDYIMADIDDISLTYLKSAFSPFKFTGYKAVADKNGNLSVDMQFKMPETDYQGNKLSGNLKVEVYRGQSPTPVYSDNNAVPGQLVKWTDTQAQHGKNTYMIVAENSYGRSEVLTDTLFVGRDAADLVLDLACKATPDNKDAVLSWKAPEEGANGGVIVESEMSYNIYTEVFLANTLTGSCASSASSSCRSTPRHSTSSPSPPIPERYSPRQPAPHSWARQSSHGPWCLFLSAVWANRP